MANAQRQAARRSCPPEARVAAWAVRIVFAVVFVLNVQCAVQFIATPQSFMSHYELSGIAGQAALQGMGIAFLMWNCTYPAVIVNPCRFFSLGIVVLVQQAVGLVGELLLASSLPTGHSILHDSISRFAAFDGAGLFVMLVAFIWLALKLRRSRKASSAEGVSAS